jgi:hypothetical protein
LIEGSLKEVRGFGRREVGGQVRLEDESEMCLGVFL